MRPATDFYIEIAGGDIARRMIQALSFACYIVLSQEILMSVGIDFLGRSNHWKGSAWIA